MAFAKVQTRRVPLAEALARLGCRRSTFDRRFRPAFTRLDGGRVMVLEDELDAAVVGGPAAVLALRFRRGRVGA